MHELMICTVMYAYGSGLARVVWYRGTAPSGQAWITRGMLSSVHTQMSKLSSVIKLIVIEVMHA